MKKFALSKVSIVGWFAGLSLLLTIPLALLLSQQSQEIQSNAATPTSKPIAISPGFGFIAGYLYNDTDKDGEREPEEKPFPGVTVQIKQIQKNTPASDVTPIVATLKTDASGYFKFRFANTSLQTSVYVVKVVLPDGYKTNTTNPLIVTDLPANNRKLIEFGLFPGISTTPIPSLQPQKRTTTNSSPSAGTKPL